MKVNRAIPEVFCQLRNTFFGKKPRPPDKQWVADTLAIVAYAH